MSVQFGRWNFDGRPVDAEYLEKVSRFLAPYAPDGNSSHSAGGVSILYGAFHTTKESRRETQPCVLPSGEVLTWDGRLDNRDTLICELRGSVSRGCPDVSIVAAAYDRWGTNSFAKFLGDWALSFWDLNKNSILLARDFVGVRSLYYSVEKDHVAWSTVLDPLVLFAERIFALDEEYIAGWLSSGAAAHLTPYVGIRSVPPSCYVRLKRGRTSITEYWNFDPGKRIHYRDDGEYEEHFRAVFGEAVRRRLRSDRPILAELSGGMDSSSIVCMADVLLARGAADAPRLDTVSYYDDSEPNWNERPFFTRVEEKRGRTGRHINVSQIEVPPLGFPADRPAATPGSSSCCSEAKKQFAECLKSQGSRVVLSGVGGDEFLGGVPTPTPELADLLARANFGKLSRQLVAWAIARRCPVIYLLRDTVSGFLPPVLNVFDSRHRPPRWLRAEFVRHNRAALRGFRRRLRLFSPLPSFQENLSALDALRRQLSCAPLPSEPAHETYYPCLDRDLLEFVFAIPREQLVRPQQRRSLMRRALAGIVPDEILNRRRKAYVARGPIAAVQAQWPALAELGHNMISASLGVVDEKAFGRMLQSTRQNKEPFTVALSRTLLFEAWIRCLAARGMLVAASQPTGPASAWPAVDFSAEKN